MWEIELASFVSRAILPSDKVSQLSRPGEVFRACTIYRGWIWLLHLEIWIFSNSSLKLAEFSFPSGGNGW